VIHAITHDLRWPTLRPIQILAAAPILRGHNTLLIAATAGGKTEAAAFPLFTKILQHPRRGLAVVWLSPLRALATQLHERLHALGGMTGVTVGLWHGDVDTTARKAWLDEPTDVLITTPESIEALLARGASQAQAVFGQLRAVVVDELHAFAGEARGLHVASLLARLSRAGQRDLQRIALSATLAAPDAVWPSYCGRSARAAVVVNSGSPERERRLRVDCVFDAELRFDEVAASLAGRRALVFCATRAAVEATAAALAARGLTARPHHGGLVARRRAEVEEELRSSPAIVVVCTSTLELGIDVGDLDCIVQLGAPPSVMAFMQRIGRTGRRVGATPTAIMIASDRNDLLLCCASISLAMDGWLEPTPAAECFAVLKHQARALVAARGTLDAAEIRWLVDEVPEFSALGTGAIPRAISELLDDGSLTRVDETIVAGEAPGPTSTHARSRFAVFGDGRDSRLVDDGLSAIGIVDGTLPCGTIVQLDGRLWEVSSTSGDRVHVRPAAAGSAPSTRVGRSSGERLSHDERVIAEAAAFALTAERPVWLAERAWAVVRG
jgi:ATP-dependent Lhr-like helicase